MGVPSATELLRVWEQGQQQPPAQQALMLLAVAYPDQSWDTLTHMSVGHRDSLLLTLRHHLFGPRLACVADCPTCQEKLELDLNVPDLYVSTSPPEGPFTLNLEDYVIQFRLPTGGDLVAIASETDPEQAQQTLLQRCLQTVSYQGHPVSHGLPAAVLERLVDAIADLDPQADIQFVLDCPACGHHWSLGFDIASFLLSELQVWAYRLLQDVHRLARAYGWSEADIVGLSPTRRQLYVEMASYG